MKIIKGPCPLDKECESVGQRNGETVIIRCPWYKQLQGKNPQTGENIDEFDCSIGWLPILMCEHTKEAKGTTVATESLRNAVSETGGTLIALANKNRLQAIGD